MAICDDTKNAAGLSRVFLLPRPKASRLFPIYSAGRRWNIALKAQAQPRFLLQGCQLWANKNKTIIYLTSTVLDVQLYNAQEMRNTNNHYNQGGYYVT
jgi:hypothetical protein